jgi:hypothetical protein
LKIIFLDIDGVMNTQTSMMEAAEQEKPLLLDRACVARLQKLVERTGADLVLSSVWRLSPGGLGFIARALVAAGWQGRPPLIGRTPRLFQKQRGDEIAEWVTDNGPIEAMVILDDDSDMSVLMHKLVQCNYVVGLTDVEVEKAAALLA